MYFSRTTYKYPGRNLNARGICRDDQLVVRSLKVEKRVFRTSTTKKIIVRAPRLTLTALIQLSLVLCRAPFLKKQLINR